LDLVRALEMERHVDTCPRCGAIAERQRTLRAVLTAVDVRHDADPQLADRIRARVGAPLADVAAPRSTVTTIARSAAAPASLASTRPPADDRSIERLRGREERATGAAK